MPQYNQTSNEDASFRVIIILLIAIPLIGWLLSFAYKKYSQSEAKAKECEVSCTAKGYAGYDFKWDVFGEPKCECVGEQQ